MYKYFFKRLFDILFSFLGLLVLSPVFIAVSLILTIASKRTPFFVQRRPGKGEKIFKLIKFRTMNDKKDENGNLLPDAARLTGTGKFIRKTSLDEIPQLLNVLKGDMSLTGPRPLLIQYLPLYNEFQKKRHKVRPGITGWAQVNGRNAISWQKKFEYDVWYVEHINLRLDIKILLLTIKKVLLAEGVNERNSATIENFKGNP